MLNERIHLDKAKKLDISYYNSFKNYLDCSICKKLIINPIYCNYCNVGFCKQCIDERHIKNNKKWCQICHRNSLGSSQLLDDVIKKMEIICECGCKVNLLNFSSHLS